MGNRLIQILASLAHRRALRGLDVICETQHQISTRKLEQYIEQVGDELAGNAFHLRIEYDALTSKLATLEAENAKLRAELGQRAVDGWKLVPVERIKVALEFVQNAMEDAYNNAYQECCGRGHGQCCGDPVPAWSDEDTAIMDALAPAQRELSALLAAAPSAPKADDRPLYTCIGKGGEYRYMGTAIGAGDSRGELVEVYQDENGQLYHRTPEDFMERMEPIAAARKGEGE